MHNRILKRILPLCDTGAFKAGLYKWYHTSQAIIYLSTQRAREKDLTNA